MSVRPAGEDQLRPGHGHPGHAIVPPWVCRACRRPAAGALVGRAVHLPAQHHRHLRRGSVRTGAPDRVHRTDLARPRCVHGHRCVLLGVPQPGTPLPVPYRPACDLAHHVPLRGRRRAAVTAHQGAVPGDCYPGVSVPHRVRPHPRDRRDRLHDRAAHRHRRVDRAHGPAVLLHRAGRLAGRRGVCRQPGPQSHRARVHGRAGS